jgi:hypothetical protein
MIIIATSKGEIHLQLDDENTPLTCENFRHYIQEGFYNDTIFHRVIPGFMVQGGGMTADMRQKATARSVMKQNQQSQTSAVPLQWPEPQSLIQPLHNFLLTLLIILFLILPLKILKVMVIVFLVKWLKVWM